MNRSLSRSRLVTHVVAMSALVMVIFSLLAILSENATLDMNPKTGLFGWLDN